MWQEPGAARASGRWIGVLGVASLHLALGWGLWKGLGGSVPPPKPQRIPFAVITEAPPQVVDRAVAGAAPDASPKPLPPDRAPPRAEVSAPPPLAPAPRPPEPLPTRSPSAAAPEPAPRETSMATPTPTPTPAPTVSTASPAPPAAVPGAPASDKGLPPSSEGGRPAAPSDGGVAAAPTGPVRAEVSVLCPGYRDQLEADLSGLVERYGVEGDVRVQIVVRGGEIEEVRTLSGPREYHAAVRSAVRRFHCRVAGSDAPRTATLTVTFRQD